jgi:hypothetical protein
MKKIITAIVLSALVFGGGLSAQERQNAVFVDLGYPLAGLILGGFGIGGGYERALLPQVSVRANVGYLGFSVSDYDFTGFDISAGARFYPLRTAVSKLYIEGALGYSPISVTYKSEEASTNLFTVAGVVGWKAVFGVGFFLEPYIGYRYGIGELNLPSGLNSISYSATGLSYGIGLGWAF